MDWILVFCGLVLLLLAGDALVKGAVNLALRLGIPALIVSLTVVAFGTSAPELLVSVDAILNDTPGIAMGNVVGSNTANILLVLGLPALIATLPPSADDTRASYLQMIAATALFTVLAFFGVFTWWSGLILLAALAAMLTHAALGARRARRAAAAAPAEEDLEGADPAMPGWRIALYLVLGIIGLPLGADLLVSGASGIARAFGIGETAIGLTLVAIGTSLPELATTGIAAIKRQADVAMGNVIGSNMFNLLAIIGIASLVGPIPVEAAVLHFDIWVMIGASLLLAPFVFLRRQIGHVSGAALTALYVLYGVIVLA